MEPKNWWFVDVAPFPKSIFRFHVSFPGCRHFFPSIFPSFLCRSSQIWCLCIWSWPFPPGLVPLTSAVNSVNSAALRRPTRCWERKAFFGTWPWRKCKKCPSSGWKPMQLLENLDEILMKLWSCLVMFCPTIFWNGMKQVLFLSERWTLWACLDVLRASCQSCHFSFSYLVIGILLCRFSGTHIWFQVLMQFPTVPFPLCLSDLWVLSWTHLYRFCWGFSATLAPQSLQIVSSLHFVSLSRYLLALASCVMRATEVTYTSALDVSKHHWLHSCELLKHIAPSCYSCSVGIVVWDVWGWELLNVSIPQSRLCSSSGLWDGRYSATGGIELLQPLTCFLQGKKPRRFFCIHELWRWKNMWERTDGMYRGSMESRSILVPTRCEDLTLFTQKTCILKRSSPLKQHGFCRVYWDAQQMLWPFNMFSGGATR